MFRTVHLEMHLNCMSKYTAMLIHVEHMVLAHCKLRMFIIADKAKAECKRSENDRCGKDYLMSLKMKCHSHTQCCAPGGGECDGRVQ